MVVLVRLHSVSGDLWRDVSPHLGTTTGDCLQQHCFSQKASSGYASFSHDIERIALSDLRETVAICDPKSGEPSQTLVGHTAGVVTTRFSGNHNLLLTGSFDCTVRVWDGNNIESNQVIEEETLRVRRVKLFPDATRIVSVSPNNTIKIWDVGDGNCLQTMRHDGIIIAISLSHDFTKLAAASIDGIHKIWNLTDGECLQTFRTQESRYVDCRIAFSHDSRKVASFSFSRNVSIWDANTGQCLVNLPGDYARFPRMNVFVFSHDSAWVAAVSQVEQIYIWDTNNGKLLHIFDNARKHTVRSMAFSHDSKKLAASFSDGFANIWDTNSGECLLTLSGHNNSVSSVAFSHSSDFLATSSGDQTVKIWDTHDGRCLQTLMVGKSLRDIQFTITDTHIRTELGTIALNVSKETSGSETIARYEGVGMSSDHAWITYDSEKILLVPPEYRAKRSAVAMNTISVGSGSGKVLIYNFEPELRGT